MKGNGPIQGCHDIYVYYLGIYLGILKPEIYFQKKGFGFFFYLQLDLETFQSDSRLLRKKTSVKIKVSLDLEINWVGLPSWEKRFQSLNCLFVVSPFATTIAIAKEQR